MINRSLQNNSLIQTISNKIEVSNEKLRSDIEKDLLVKLKNSILHSNYHFKVLVA